MSEIKTYRDLADLAWGAAEQFVRLAAEAITSRGVFNVALSGGSTPLPLYALLALPEWAARVNWPRVQVFWGDERCVPPDHRDSNYRMANNALLGVVPLPVANIHRMRGEIDPAQAAEEYERVIAEVRFDLILLGMGGDGHTASLFPGTAVIHEQKRRVVAHYVDKLSMWRLTLTPPVINAARNVTFLVAGTDKAERLREVLQGPYQPDVLPSQIVKPEDGQLYWLVDKAAAALL
jgi:6-phosphogluconolactonase